MAAGFPALICLITAQYMSLNQTPGFLHNPRGILQRIYLLLLEQGVKFTAVFLADNAQKLAVIPTEEMCQLLMGLSIELPFPQDLRKTDTVVLTVTLQTAGFHTLTYQSYHNCNTDTPPRACIHTPTHTCFATSQTSPLHLHLLIALNEAMQCMTSECRWPCCNVTS